MNRALRDDTRKAAVAAIEYFAAHYVRYTEKMTETQRYELLGVHTWHPGHPIEVPGTVPELSPRPGHIRQIILEYKDLGAKHPGKPDKVHGLLRGPLGDRAGRGKGRFRGHCVGCCAVRQ